MEDLKKFAFMVDDVYWLTINQAAKVCNMKEQAFRNIIKKFTTTRFSNIVFVKMDEVVEFQNCRLYMKSLREKQKNK